MCTGKCNSVDKIPLVSDMPVIFGMQSVSAEKTIKR